MGKTPTRISIALPTNVYFLSGIRDFTFDAVHNVAGFTEQWSRRFQTVVDEVVNNAIEHGSTEGDQIVLTFEMEEQKSVAVTVSNGSKRGVSAAELNEKVEAARKMGEKPRFGLRGRGLQIIVNWCDEVLFTDTEEGGVALTVKKNYNPEEWQDTAMTGKTNVLVLDV